MLFTAYKFVGGQNSIWENVGTIDTMDDSDKGLLKELKRIQSPYLVKHHEYMIKDGEGKTVLAVEHYVD